MKTELELKARNNKETLRSIRRCLSISEWDDSRKMTEIVKVVEERKSYTDAGLERVSGKTPLSTTYRTFQGETKEEWMIPRKGDGKTLQNILLVPLEVRNAVLDKILYGSENAYADARKCLVGEGYERYSWGICHYTHRQARDISGAEHAAALLQGVRRGFLCFRMKVVPGTKRPRMIIANLKSKDLFPQYEWFTELPDSMRSQAFFGRNIPCNSNIPFTPDVL
jgi:hypothetical protein